MRWRPERPWFGPGPYGKVRPVSRAGRVVVFGALALAAGLIALAAVLPHLLIVALVAGLALAALAVLAVTYGPPRP